jgi:heat shock protein HtpX
MQKTMLPRDTGLQARMLVTMFLLGAVYAVLVGALLAAGAGAVIVALVAAGMFVFQLFASDKLALRMMGAHEVSPAEAPDLHSMIDRLCVQADLPKPRVAVAQTSLPNAFAVGRSRKSATVCVTTGITQLLGPHELEGVLAHELSHISHRDMVIMTVASFFATIAAYILQFGFFFGGGNDRNPGIIGLIGVSVAVYAVSFFLMQALSRYREFAADRGAAIITGRPSALASALLKISGQMKSVPQRDLRAAAELNAFFIVPARVRSSLSGLFSTHPPVERRIEALERIEAEMHGRGPATSYREITAV